MEEQKLTVECHYYVVEEVGRAACRTAANGTQREILDVKILINTTMVTDVQFVLREENFEGSYRTIHLYYIRTKFSACTLI